MYILNIVDVSGILSVLVLRAIENERTKLHSRK